MSKEVSHSRSIKNYLIRPKDQLLHAIFALSATLIACGAQSVFLLRKIQEIHSQHESSDLQLALQAELLRTVLLSFFVTSLAVGLFIFVFNVMLTHRVFGSVHALETYIRKILNGEKPPRLTLRKLDQTQTLADLVNQLSDRIPGATTPRDIKK